MDKSCVQCNACSAQSECHTAEPMSMVCDRERERFSLPHVRQTAGFTPSHGNRFQDRIVSRDKQVGGTHYNQHKIQPWDIVIEYDLSFFEGNALKYLLRKKNNRVEDLAKAIHYLEQAKHMAEQEVKP